MLLHGQPRDFLGVPRPGSGRQFGLNSGFFQNADALFDFDKPATTAAPAGGVIDQKRVGDAVSHRVRRCLRGKRALYNN